MEEEEEWWVAVSEEFEQHGDQLGVKTTTTRGTKFPSSTISSTNIKPAISLPSSATTSKFPTTLSCSSSSSSSSVTKLPKGDAVVLPRSPSLSSSPQTSSTPSSNSFTFTSASSSSNSSSNSDLISSDRPLSPSPPSSSSPKENSTPSNRDGPSNEKERERGRQNENREMNGKKKQKTSPTTFISIPSSNTDTSSKRLFEARRSNSISASSSTSPSSISTSSSSSTSSSRSTTLEGLKEEEEEEEEEQDEVQVIEQPKRRIPGPAGDLPENSKELLDDRKGMDFDERYLDRRYRPEPSLFTSSNAWLAMMQHYTLPPFGDSKLHYNISYASKQIVKRVPQLTVLVREFRVSDGDIVAMLVDPSGELQGILHKSVMDQYSGEFTPGCVLVLDGITVFNPNEHYHYLNIAGNNVTRIFSGDSPRPTLPHSSSSSSSSLTPTNDDEQETGAEFDISLQELYSVIHNPPPRRTKGKVAGRATAKSASRGGASPKRANTSYTRGDPSKSGGSIHNPYTKPAPPKGGRGASSTSTASSVRSPKALPPFASSSSLPSPSTPKLPTSTNSKISFPVISSSTAKTWIPHSATPVSLPSPKASVISPKLGISSPKNPLPYLPYQPPKNWTPQSPSVSATPPLQPTPTPPSPLASIPSTSTTITNPALQRFRPVTVQQQAPTTLPYINTKPLQTPSPQPPPLPQQKEASAQQLHQSQEEDEYEYGVDEYGEHVHVSDYSEESENTYSADRYDTAVLLGATGGRRGGGRELSTSADSSMEDDDIDSIIAGLDEEAILKSTAVTRTTSL